MRKRLAAATTQGFDAALRPGPGLGRLRLTRQLPPPAWPDSARVAGLHVRMSPPEYSPDTRPRSGCPRCGVRSVTVRPVLKDPPGGAAGGRVAAPSPQSRGGRTAAGGARPSRRLRASRCRDRSSRRCSPSAAAAAGLAAGAGPAARRRPAGSRRPPRAAVATGRRSAGRCQMSSPSRCSSRGRPAARRRAPGLAAVPPRRPRAGDVGVADAGRRRCSGPGRRRLLGRPRRRRRLVVACAFLYQGLIHWNRVRTLTSDPSDWLNGVSAVFALAAVAQPRRARGSPERFTGAGRVAGAGAAVRRGGRAHGARHRRHRIRDRRPDPRRPRLVGDGGLGVVVAAQVACLVLGDSRCRSSRAALAAVRCRGRRLRAAAPGTGPRPAENQSAVLGALVVLVSGVAHVVVEGRSRRTTTSLVAGTPRSPSSAEASGSSGWSRTCHTWRAPSTRRAPTSSPASPTAAG